MGRKSRIAAYVVGGISLTALAGSLAFAGAPEMNRWHGGGHGFMGSLHEMDVDANGSVTRAEVDAFAAARAAEIDADKNGEVTVAELEAFREAQRQKRLAERLAAMDSDGDGKVTVAELEAASTWRFARFDRDGDGTIELRRMGRHGHGRGMGPDGSQN